MLEKVLVLCMTYESWIEMTRAHFVNDIVPKFTTRSICPIWMKVFKHSSNDKVWIKESWFEIHKSNLKFHKQIFSKKLKMYES